MLIGNGPACHKGRQPLSSMTRRVSGSSLFFLLLWIALTRSWALRQVQGNSAKREKVAYFSKLKKREYPDRQTTDCEENSELSSTIRNARAWCIYLISENEVDEEIKVTHREYKEHW